jgi:hypothetical protein
MKTKAALREICGAAARVWTLTARPGKEPEPMSEYIYVEHRWVMVTIQYNGEEKPPRRRATEKEADYLAPGPERMRTPTDRVMCASCGEESIYVWRDPADFCCSVCGGAVMEYNSYTQGLPPFTHPDNVFDTNVYRNHSQNNQ